VTYWSPHAGAVYLEGSLEEAKQLFGRLLFNDKVFMYLYDLISILKITEEMLSFPLIYLRITNGQE